MNWNKAKNYLILGFVIVNIILIFSILGQMEHYNTDFSKKSLNNLKTLLNQKNITYDFKLDNKKSKVNAISINYATLDDIFYENITKKYNKDIKVIDDYFVELNLEKKIKNIKELEEFSKSFIEENFDKATFKLKDVFAENNNMIVEYEEQYKGLFLETGYIKFMVTSKDKVGISILKTKQVKEVGNSVDAMSNAQAISKLLPKLKENIHIISLEKGYYTVKYDENNQNKELKSLRILPYYRAKLSDNTFLYTIAVEN